MRHTSSLSLPRGCGAASAASPWQWRDIDREQLNIHSLRHTAASLMIAGGADMATVAGILGHSQLSATLDIYYPRLR